MTTPRNPEDGIVGGLRRLADFLERTPDLPRPMFADVTYHVRADSDESQRDEINRIAAMLGTAPYSQGEGHYVADIAFNDVSYRAVAISRESMARYRAGSTYIDVVCPDDWPSI